MHRQLSDEHRLLANSARSFFASRQPVSALRNLRDERDPVGFERALWQEMVDLGWAGLLIPEAYGGVDFGYAGLGQILEAAGRTLAATPLVSTALLSAPLIRATGNDEQRRELLTAISAGERIVALALDETPRHAPLACALRAIAAPDGYVLQGRKTFVLDGHIADDLIVVARTAGSPGDLAGLSLFRVAGNAAGLTRSRSCMVDSRNAATLAFDRVKVNADALLGAPDEAFRHLDPVLDGARAGLAAEMLGGTLEAFERTLNYLKLRQQFGVAIGSFQALKHRAAQMFCEIELTRSAVEAALLALDAGDRDAPLLSSLAKARACETFELVSNEAVQLHGGIGMTDAEEIGFFLKRARVAQQTFGDAGFHRARYADLQGY